MPIASRMIEATEKAEPEWYQTMKKALKSRKGVVTFFSQ